MSHDHNKHLSSQTARCMDLNMLFCLKPTNKAEPHELYKPTNTKTYFKKQKEKKNVVLKMPVTVDQSLLQVTADWLAQQENKTNLCKEFSRNWCCLCSDISKILLWGSQYIFSFFVLSKFKTQSESPLLVLHSQGASFSHKTLLLVK